MIPKLFQKSASTGGKRSINLKRMWLRLGTFVVSAALVLLAAFGYLTVHFAHMLETELANLKAESAFVTVDDFLESADVGGAEEDVEGQRVVDFFMGLTPDDFDAPVLAGGMEILGEALIINPPRILENWNPEVEAGVRDACARNAALIEELIAIGNAPVPRLGTWIANNYDPNEFFVMYAVPNLLALRGGANLLGLRAILWHKDGHDDEVLHTAATILKIAHHVSNSGHTLINEMIATAIRNIAVQTAQLVEEDAHYSEQGIREFCGALEEAVHPEYLTRAFEWERLAGIDSLWRLRPVVVVIEDPLSRLTAYFLRDYYATNYIRVMNLMVTATTVPAYEHKALLDKLKTLSKDTDSSMGPYASMMLPNGMRSLLQVIDTEISLRTAQIALATKLYHQDHDRYPDTLEALVPDYLDVLHNDPFSGKPYLYSYDDAGIRVYSVGTNYVDDGGLGTDRLDVGWGLKE